MVFLHAHLQVVYYNCVKFHKNSISSLVGVALTRYMPPPLFRESIRWIISPFKFWTATIFLYAHLQVVYYKCVKFHKNPISRLGGVALTRYMDGRTGWSLYTPLNFVCGWYKKIHVFPIHVFIAKKFKSDRWENVWKGPFNEQFRIKCFDFLEN